MSDYLNEIVGYKMKVKDKKIIKEFINGCGSGSGDSLWIEEDYLYGPYIQNTGDFIAMRNEDGEIVLGMAYGTMSKTWIDFVKKNI